MTPSSARPARPAWYALDRRVRWWRWTRRMRSSPARVVRDCAIVRHQRTSSRAAPPQSSARRTSRRAKRSPRAPRQRPSETSGAGFGRGTAARGSMRSRPAPCPGLLAGPKHQLAATAHALDGHPPSRNHRRCADAAAAVPPNCLPSPWRLKREFCPAPVGRFGWRGRNVAASGSAEPPGRR